MLNDAAAFLAALAENEDDETTRRIYADWLEEQGQYDEALRQRKWTGAKAWLVKLLADCDEESDPDDEPNPYYPRPSFRRLCELAQDAVTQMEREGQSRVYIDCGANMDLMDALQIHVHEFWKNWSIVTGVATPPDLAGRSFFSCGC